MHAKGPPERTLQCINIIIIHIHPSRPMVEQFFRNRKWLVSCFLKLEIEEHHLSCSKSVAPYRQHSCKYAHVCNIFLTWVVWFACGVSAGAREGNETTQCNIQLGTWSSETCLWRTPKNLVECTLFITYPFIVIRQWWVFLNFFVWFK